MTTSMRRRGVVITGLIALSALTLLSASATHAMTSDWPANTERNAQMARVRPLSPHARHAQWAADGRLVSLADMPLVELNQASLADLESVAGIGPSLSTRLLSERQRGGFVDWADLVARVKGVGWHGALRLSRAGLRVGGQAHPEDRAVTS